MIAEEQPPQPLQNEPDPGLNFYQPIMLEGLSSEQLPERARVMCHGYVTQINPTPKLLNFKLFDATCQRQCSLFVNSGEDDLYLPDDYSQIKAGVFMTVMALKETREFRGESQAKLLVHRYRIIRDVDQQMHWAILTLRAVRENSRAALSKSRNRSKLARAPAIVDRPLQYRSLLFRCLFRIVDETPELSQVTIVLSTLLKNRELAEWRKKNSTEGDSIEEGMKESLRQFADVHFLEIDEQPQRPTKYVVRHRIFKELLTKILSFIQSHQATGVDPETVHAYAQREIYGTNIRTQHLFDMEGLYLLLQKLQNDRKIYRTSDSRLFVLAS